MREWGIAWSSLLSSLIFPVDRSSHIAYSEAAEVVEAETCTVGAVPPASAASAAGLGAAWTTSACRAAAAP